MINWELLRWAINASENRQMLYENIIKLFSIDDCHLQMAEYLMQILINLFGKRLVGIFYIIIEILFS